MLVGLSQDEAKAHASSETLYVMDSLTQKFWLTGSVSFGMENPKSDIDFYTTQDGCPDAWYKAMGFYSHLSSKYCLDPNTARVWRHRARKVDIQVVHNIEWRHFVQRILSQEEMRPLSIIDKQLRPFFYAFVYKVLGEYAD